MLSPPQLAAPRTPLYCSHAVRSVTKSQQSPYRPPGEGREDCPDPNPGTISYHTPELRGSQVPGA